MDLNGVERIDFNALGGADNITVNDLTGTDVTQVDLDLAARRAAAGDGAADTVIVNGTHGDDTITVAGNGRRRHASPACAATVDDHRHRGRQRPAHRQRPGRRRHHQRVRLRPARSSSRSTAGAATTS